MNAKNQDTKVLIPKRRASKTYHMPNCSKNIDERKSALADEEDAQELGYKPHDRCVTRPRRNKVRAIWDRAGIHASFDDDGVYTELGPVAGEDVEEAISVVDYVINNE